MGVFYAILTAFFWAIFTIVIRKSAVKSSNSGILTTLFLMASSLFYLPMFVIEAPKWSSDNFVMLMLGIIVFSYAIAGVLQSASNETVDASIGAIVSKIGLPISFFGALIFLQEQLYWNRLIGMLLILLGVVVMFMKKSIFQKKIDKKGLTFRIISTLIFGLTAIIEGKISVEYSPAFYAFLGTFLPALILFIYQIIRGEKFSKFKLVFSENRLNILLLGLTNTVGYLFLINAYAIADKSLVFPIVNATLIFAVIFSFFFLNEKDHLLRKMVSVGIIMLGVILTSIM
jgi:drug/metabolite transporter (DMT)-like permease